MEEMITKKKKGKFREYAEAIITAVLVAFLIRSFVVEPFKIPSSSMVPTLLVGDHIFVNKFIYGLRIPLTKKHYFQYKTPQRGDVVVFIYPDDESKDFIKRVIGVPGDEIKFDGTDYYLNGEKLSRTEVEVTQDPSNRRLLDVTNGAWPKKIPYTASWRDFSIQRETIDGHDHLIQYEKDIVFRPLGHFVAENGGTVKVPEGSLFVSGDNRDNSSDGREWGFVPMDNVKGKAMFVWLSLDNDHGWLRLNRFGKWIE